MYIYTTPRFDGQAKQHGIQGQVAELLVAIRNQGTTAVKALFEWNYPYLKRPVRNLRLLGKIVRFKDERVLCLLDVFTRGGKEYEAFLRNPEEYGRQYLDALVGDADLENSIRAQQEKQRQPFRQPFLPDRYHGWLQRPTWARNTADRIICESEVWVRQFQRQDVRDRWQTYYEIVVGIVEGEAPGQPAPWPNLYLSQNSHYSVFYSALETADRTSRGVVFLLASFAEHPTDAALEEVLRLTNVVTTDGTHCIFSSPVTFDILSRYTRRAYPDYLVIEPEIWLEVERESGINLALSVEEEKILHELSSPDVEEASLPLFINGRAGSGKSTMLVYLFADYCDRYRKTYARQQQDTVLGPLFLTYNERLLARAREGVEKLLTNHHRFLIDGDLNGGSKLPPLAPCFQSFQEFLIHLLPPEESDRFESDRYISFYDFRRHCSRRHNRHSPELCWHIIRTFIKGYSLSGQDDGYMTPDDYQEVPRREQTISHEVFSSIYKQVWPWYRQLTRNGHWDDQDLIRRVLEVKGHDLPKYTAIFCDEAQDFTKLELLLIVQLSLFSECDLYPPVPSLPFAFAGDPFQTLNPTGFRWESVKATFFDQVISSLDPDRQLNLGMSFYELESNYRSSPAIVKMTNLIHLWRHLLFHIPKLKPQEAWRPTFDSRHPQKFIFGRRNFSPEALKRHIEKSPIFIVPCEAGGELEYIRNDEFLAPLFPGASEEHPPKNVLSAIQAKGLEFPLVILYKFGEQFAREFGRSLWDCWTADGEHPLELEYFFNKLYVAASRGMSDLVVVDTEAGEQLLWQYATMTAENGESPELRRWLERVENRPLWEGHIGGIGWGENLGDLDLDNRESQAKEFEENGRSQKDAVSLRRAKQFYRELGKLEEADLCEAWALRFDRRFLEAGLIFLRRLREDEAWDCFWQGCCWQALQDWYRQFPERRGGERPLVEFMATPTKTAEETGQLTAFLEEALAENRPGENRLSKPWKAAVKEYAAQVKRILGEKQLSRGEWRRLGEVLEALDEAKYEGLLEMAGECFYRGQNLRRAVRCWQDCGATDRRDYNLAVAELLEFPEGLPYLERAGNCDRIVAEWERAGRPVTPQWLKYGECVGRVLERQNRHRDWVEYLARSRQWGEAIAVLERCPKSEMKVLQFDLIRQLARSNLTPEQVRESRSRYMTLLDRILSRPDWTDYLAVPEVGVVLEKIGDLVRTLRFYERFAGSNDPHLRRFARERWMVNKIKQQQYAMKVEPARGQEIRREIERRARVWGIRLAALPADLPRIEREPQEDSPRRETAGLRGLPPGVPVLPLSRDGNSYSFRIDAVEVRVARREDRLWVEIADLQTLKTLKIEVDGRGGRVRIGNVLVGAADGERLLFQGPAEGCGGAIVYRESPPRVELKLRDRPEAIVV